MLTYSFIFNVQTCEKSISPKIPHLRSIRELFTWAACHSIGLLTVLHLAFLFSDLVKDGCLLSKFTCNRMATVVKRRTESCVFKPSWPHPSKSSSAVTSDPRWVTFQKHSSHRGGGGFTQNCRSNNIEGQYDVAYHILMILQCPGPWWRQRQQGGNLLWRDLPSGGQIRSCSRSVLISGQKLTRDVSRELKANEKAEQRHGTITDVLRLIHVLG